MRREHLDLKASHQQSLGKIKALQDRVSAQGIQKVRSQDLPPPQARTNALPPPKPQPHVEKQDCQTQTGLLPPPYTPRIITSATTCTTQKRTSRATHIPQTVATTRTPQTVATTRTPQTVATTHTPQTVATTRTHQTVATTRTPHISTSAVTHTVTPTTPDTPRLNSTRQSPPALRLPKEGRLSALLIGDSNLRHVDRKRLDTRGNLHVRTVGGATAGDIAACLLNQSSRADTKHVVVHIGTNDCSRDSDYNKQLVMVSFQALAKQLVRVFPKAAVAFTSILPKRSGHTLATEEANKMLKDMCSSCGFELLHHPLLGGSTRSLQKQLYTDEVHLNQRGLATLLRSIIAFLSGSRGSCSPISKDRQRHSARLYSVVARGGGVDQLRRGSASLPLSQRQELRVQDSQRKTDSAPRLQDHQDNQQPQPRDGLGHGVDPHHTPPPAFPPFLQWRHSGGPPLPPTLPPFPFQAPWNFNPYHPWTPHFPQQRLSQTPPNYF